MMRPLATVVALIAVGISIAGPTVAENQTRGEGHWVALRGGDLDGVATVRMNVDHGLLPLVITIFSGEGDGNVTGAEIITADEGFNGVSVQSNPLDGNTPSLSIDLGKGTYSGLNISYNWHSNSTDRPFLVISIISKEMGAFESKVDAPSGLIMNETTGDRVLLALPEDFSSTARASVAPLALGARVQVGGAFSWTPVHSAIGTFRQGPTSADQLSYEGPSGQLVTCPCVISRTQEAGEALTFHAFGAGAGPSGFSDFVLALADVEMPA